MTHRHLRICALLALLPLGACGGGLAVSGSTDASGASAVLRTTTYGPVEGNDDARSNGTYSWKGVPFARPPVGALRWKAPVAPEPWTTTRATRTLGNACVQTGRLYGPGLHKRYDASIGTSIGKTTGSEDCLYLNIWAPANAAADAKLPVIVFVHGGSNITGYTGDPVYDGAALARTANAVVVSINYRLGIFGFLASPQLKAGVDPLDDSGNYALLDLIAGLKFVNANIGAFGGDAGNVTLMGQSAGAVNVYALMVSPLVVEARPALFHKLVPLSGGVVSVPPAPQQNDALLSALLIADGTVADADAATAHIASRSPAELAAYLRAQSADTLLQTMLHELAPRGLAGSAPLQDGVVLPVDPLAAIDAGRFVRVPTLVGYTRDETRLFAQHLANAPALGGISGRLLDDATVFAMAQAYNPDAAPSTSIEAWIPKVYLPVDAPQTGFHARARLYDESFFIALRKQSLPRLHAQQVPLWWYQFDWDEAPAPFDAIFGAAHTFDLPFIFGNFGPSLYSNFVNSKANAPGRLQLSQAMMHSLAAFARTGDPNHASLGTPWPRYPAMLRLDASPTATAITVEP